MNVHQVCQAQLVYELSHARMGFTSAKRAVTGMFGQLAQTGKYGFLKIGHEGMTLNLVTTVDLDRQQQGNHQLHTLLHLPTSK